MNVQNEELIKNKKRSLRRYRKNVECVSRLEEKLIVLNARLSSAKTSNYSGMPRGGSPIGVEDLISDKIELEERIGRLKKKANILKREILDEIDSLEDSRYCEVLESYFIEGLSMDEIADSLGYNERYTFQLYSEAIESLTQNVQ